MKRSTVFYGTAAVCLIIYLIMTWLGFHQECGWLLLLFFLFLGFGFRQHPLLKGLFFTLVIMSVVSLAMYYPQYFKTVGNFQLSALIIPLLQLIMFGTGTELSLK